MDKDEEILDKAELLKYLKSGKREDMLKSLIATKRMGIKTKDCLTPCGVVLYDREGNVIKANTNLSTSATLPDMYKVRVVINTTNIMDNHCDVHYPGLWGKSLKENSMIMHLQEHMRSFKCIIADGDDLKAYTKNYTWKELGYDFEGKTEALVFDSTIKRAGKKARCEFMYEQYLSGYVKNHSVGMMYVKMILCINEPDDEYYGAEFEAWEKYYPDVVNKDFADEKGFFWIHKEAKAIEGSAVPLGSNYATPTLDNNLKSEPGNHSHNEPEVSTHKCVNYDYLASNFKL